MCALKRKVSLNKIVQIKDTGRGQRKLKIHQTKNSHQVLSILAEEFQLSEEVNSKLCIFYVMNLDRKHTASIGTVLGVNLTA